MGPNDSLPPPVPSGEPPRVPPPPPAVPQFPPTEVLPPTQVTPPVPPPPAAAPPGSPMPSSAPPPATPNVPPGGPTSDPASGDGSKQHLVPWIIGAAVVIVALVLVAVFALRGDDETSGTADTTAPAPPTSVAPTSAVPTTAPATTAPATASPTIAPTTVAPTTTSLPGAVVVADDTGTFTVLMLDTFQLDTTPIDVDGTTFGRVAGATDLDAFVRQDDHDTFGAEVVVGPAESSPSAEEILSNADPGPEVCADRTTEADYPTLQGPAQVLLLDGCGTGGASAKVVMVLSVPDRGLTMVVGTQGPGPSATDLFDFTQAVVESVVFL